MTEFFAKINPTDALRLSQSAARRNRNDQIPPVIHSPEEILYDEACLFIFEISCMCLFATGLKKARAEGKQCHAKTMKSKRSCCLL